MKRILLTAILMTMLMGVAQAQPRGSHGPGPGHNPVERLTAELNLSEDQAAQVEAIFAQAQVEREALKDSQQEDHCVIRAAVDAQLMEVFTVDQAVLFEELSQQRPPRRRGPPGSQNSSGDQGPPPDDC